MSQRVKMTRFHEEKMRQALKSIADERSVEGNYGVVDFTYDEFLEHTDNAIRNKSYISAFLNTLEAQGKVTRIRRGSPIAPSRWDVKDFIESTVELPDVTVAVVEDTQVKDNETTINAIREAIEEMTEYLRVLPDQMVAHLNELSSDLDLASGGKTTELQAELDKVQEQVRDLNKQLEQANIERSQLAFDLKIKEKEVEQRREVTIDKDSVVRNKHQIIDEVERFIAAEDWKRRNMTDNFRATILTKLDTIMKEVGIS